MGRPKIRSEEYMKEYHREYARTHRKEFNEYGKKNYPKYKESKREYQRKLAARYKKEFLSMYGNVCSCCGESEFEFLTIEHKEGQTKETRRTGLVAYRDAVKEYRPDLFEILCWNCNCAKGKLGYCPHNPPEKILPYKIHNINRPYKYSKPVDSLGRRYGKQSNE